MQRVGLLRSGWANALAATETLAGQRCRDTIRPVERNFHVYFMASKSGALYVGVTGKLAQRVFQHKEKLVPGFTQKYNATKLVWFESHASIRAAIAREKEIKGWRRAKKVALIESINPHWDDLSQGI